MLSIEGTRFWLKVNRLQNRIVRDALNLSRLNNAIDAIDKLRQNTHLPIVRIFLAALELERPTPGKLRLVLEVEVQSEMPLLSRFKKIFRL